jgi:hypothetical protein
MQALRPGPRAGHAYRRARRSTLAMARFSPELVLLVTLVLCLLEPPRVYSSLPSRTPPAMKFGNFASVFTSSW